MRLGKQDGFLRMEAESNDFGKDIAQSSDPTNRLICVKAVPPVDKVCFLLTKKTL